MNLEKQRTPETVSSEESAGATTCPPTPNAPDWVYVGWSGLSRHEKYDVVGWGLFIVSAVFFLVAAVEWESLTSIMGSLFFLVACFVFLIPILWKEKPC